MGELDKNMNIFLALRDRLDQVSLFHRIVIGNGVVIVIGAICGTLLTRHLSDQGFDIGLIVLFSILGTVISVVINTWIIRTALQPVYALLELVKKTDTSIVRENRVLDRADPEIQQLAGALHDMVGQLKLQNTRLRALSQHAINAQEEERKRIARELHDDTGQALSMLLFNLQRLEDLIPENLPDANRYREGLQTTQDMTTRTLDGLRKTISGLRPAILDDLGLLPAIRWYVRSVFEQTDIQVNYLVPDENIFIPAPIATALFRISQEAVNNIVRHAQAQHVSISLYVRRGKLFFQVKDDGRGFEVGQRMSQAVRLNQLGLLGIQERVDLIGGEAAVFSTPEQGTRLEICVPVRASEKGQSEILVDDPVFADLPQ